MGAPIVILGDKPVRAILVHEKGSFTNIWHIWHLVLVLGLGLGPLLAPRRLRRVAINNIQHFVWGACVDTTKI